MRRHILTDSVPLSLGALLFRRNKMFRDGIDSPTYEELIKSTTLRWPEITGEGFYEVPARTAVGDLDPAFHVARWKSDNYPTLIYHHGNNERPFNKRGIAKNTFKKIFLDSKEDIPANLIAIRAAHHCCYRTYLRAMGRLSTLTAVLAVSVKMVEQLTRHAKKRNCRVLVVGASLGGWVANLHRTFFNTADAYIPLIAGTAPSDVFINSAYRGLTDNLARKNSSAIKEHLDFTDQFGQVEDKNVFPLLARYDQIMRLEEQEASYKNHPVKIIDMGHSTGSIAAVELRKHILPHILGKPVND